MLEQLELERQRPGGEAEIRGIDGDHRRAADMGTDDLRDGGDRRAVDGLVSHAESIAAAAAVDNTKSRRMSDQR